MDEIYALVFLHLLSPLALGAVQLDNKVPERSGLGRVKPQSAQSGIPCYRTVDGVHG